MTKKRNPDPLDRVIRRIGAIERLVLRTQAVVDMPTGTPALDAAQDAAMAAVDRAVAALKRDQARERR